MREVSNAVDFLTRRLAKLSAHGEADEEEAASARAADEALRQLLMRAAARLEAAVTDVCVPPLPFPPSPPSASASLSQRAGRGAAIAMWRCVALLRCLCLWSDLLSVPALQALAKVLLCDQLVPYLRAQLSSVTPPWAMLAAAAQTAAACLPPRWRRKSGGQALIDPLLNFLANELVPAFTRAHETALSNGVESAAKQLADALELLQNSQQANILKTTYGLL